MAVTRFIGGRRDRITLSALAQQVRARETLGAGRGAGRGPGQRGTHARPRAPAQTCTQARTGARVGVCVGRVRSRFPNCCT